VLVALRGIFREYNFTKFAGMPCGGCECVMEGARGGCGEEYVGCGCVGRGSVVSWVERVSYERSLVCLCVK